MTVKELITAGGLTITKKKQSCIGQKIRERAEELKIVYSKKREFVEVNDYPESFTSVMEDILLKELSGGQTN